MFTLSIYLAEQHTKKSLKQLYDKIIDPKESFKKSKTFRDDKKLSTWNNFYTKFSW